MNFTETEINFFTKKTGSLYLHIEDEYWNSSLKNSMTSQNGYVFRISYLKTYEYKYDYPDVSSLLFSVFLEFGVDKFLEMSKGSVYQAMDHYEKIFKPDTKKLLLFRIN